MSIQITVRDVPKSVRDSLAARAAAQGQSMQEYLRAMLERIASRPTLDSWLSQVRARKRVTRSKVSGAQITKSVDADRR